MSLSSLFFVLLFLPVFLQIYFFTPGRDFRNHKLLFFSMLFYSFGGVRYLFLIMIMTLIGWFCGIRINQARYDRSKKVWLILSVVFFVTVLFVFKYSNFFLQNVDRIIPIEIKPLEIALPMGISFYTFKLISYVADVYMEKLDAEDSYFMLLLYAIIFPQVLQGPIARYEDMRRDLYQRRVRYSSVASGIYRFSLGLAKKTVLADRIGEIVSTFSPATSAVSSTTTVAVWMGALCFTLQMYLDFSAYTDMAIGIGEMLGFDFPENFNYPYAATSIKDFWRRWHMTLSSFFRDYVYIPLGGNRVGGVRVILNLLIVWFLTGLWHGASWNFVLWGLFYVPFIILENWGTKYQINWIPRIFKHIYTIIIFNVGWIFFRFTDLNQLKEVLMIFFGLKSNEFSNPAVILNIKNNAFLIGFAIIVCTPVFKLLYDKFVENMEEEEGWSIIVHGFRTFVSVILLFLSIMAMAKNSFTPFLYNQF